MFGVFQVVFNIIEALYSPRDGTARRCMSIKRRRTVEKRGKGRRIETPYMVHGGRT